MFFLLIIKTLTTLPVQKSIYSSLLSITNVDFY